MTNLSVSNKTEIFSKVSNQDQKVSSSRWKSIQVSSGVIFTVSLVAIIAIFVACHPMMNAGFFLTTTGICSFLLPSSVLTISLITLIVASCCNRKERLIVIPKKIDITTEPKPPIIPDPDPDEDVALGRSSHDNESLSTSLKSSSQQQPNPKTPKTSSVVTSKETEEDESSSKMPESLKSSNANPPLEESPELEQNNLILSASANSTRKEADNDLSIFDPIGGGAVTDEILPHVTDSSDSLDDIVANLPQLEPIVVPIKKDTVEKPPKYTEKQVLEEFAKPLFLKVGSLLQTLLIANYRAELIANYRAKYPDGIPAEIIRGVPAKITKGIDGNINRLNQALRAIWQLASNHLTSITEFQTYFSKTTLEIQKSGADLSTTPDKGYSKTKETLLTRFKDALSKTLKELSPNVNKTSLLSNSGLFKLFKLKSKPSSKEFGLELGKLIAKILEAISEVNNPTLNLVIETITALPKDKIAAILDTLLSLKRTKLNTIKSLINNLLIFPDLKKATNELLGDIRPNFPSLETPVTKWLKNNFSNARKQAQNKEKMLSSIKEHKEQFASALEKFLQTTTCNKEAAESEANRINTFLDKIKDKTENLTLTSEDLRDLRKEFSRSSEVYKQVHEILDITRVNHNETAKFVESEKKTLENLFQESKVNADSIIAGVKSDISKVFKNSIPDQQLLTDTMKAVFPDLEMLVKQFSGPFNQMQEDLKKIEKENSDLVKGILSTVENASLVSDISNDEMALIFEEFIFECLPHAIEQLMNDEIKDQLKDLGKSLEIDVLGEVQKKGLINPIQLEFMMRLFQPMFAIFFDRFLELETTMSKIQMEDYIVTKIKELNVNSDPVISELNRQKAALESPEMSMTSEVYSTKVMGLEEELSLWKDELAKISLDDSQRPSIEKNVKQLENSLRILKHCHKSLARIQIKLTELIGKEVSIVEIDYEYYDSNFPGLSADATSILQKNYTRELDEISKLLRALGITSWGFIVVEKQDPKTDLQAIENKITCRSMALKEMAILAVRCSIKMEYEVEFVEIAVEDADKEQQEDKTLTSTLSTEFLDTQKTIKISDKLETINRLNKNAGVKTIVVARRKNSNFYQEYLRKRIEIELGIKIQLKEENPFAISLVALEADRETDYQIIYNELHNHSNLDIEGLKDEIKQNEKDDPQKSEALKKKLKLQQEKLAAFIKQCKKAEFIKQCEKANDALREHPDIKKLDAILDTPNSGKKYYAIPKSKEKTTNQLLFIKSYQGGKIATALSVALSVVNTTRSIDSLLSLAEKFGAEIPLGLPGLTDSENLILRNSLSALIYLFGRIVFDLGLSKDAAVKDAAKHLIEKGLATAITKKLPELLEKKPDPNSNGDPAKDLIKGLVELLEVIMDDLDPNKVRDNPGFDISKQFVKK